MTDVDAHITVMAVATELRARFAADDPGSSRVSFTHIETSPSPIEVLTRLRGSCASRLMIPDGSLLNHPTTEWYVPVLPVYATDRDAVDAYITASVWDMATWGWEAAELEVRIVYEQERSAYQAVALSTSAERGLALHRYTYDIQRAETGYEGEMRVTDSPTPTDAIAFVRLVSGIVGE